MQIKRSFIIICCHASFVDRRWLRGNNQTIVASEELLWRPKSAILEWCFRGEIGKVRVSRVFASNQRRVSGRGNYLRETGENSGRNGAALLGKGLQKSLVQQEYKPAFVSICVVVIVVGRFLKIKCVIRITSGL